ncbi:hypothetical protein EC991_002783 [Linnemannia zychae]|nr:hypothetical protein EC991_002783 [Linnemannia zychae]
MKFTQPLFLLTLSIASALTLFAESAPSSSTLDKRSIPVPAQADHVAAVALASKRHSQQRRQLQQKRGGLSSPPLPSTDFETVAAHTPTTYKGKKTPTTRKRLDKSAVSAASKIEGGFISSTSSSPTPYSQKKQQQLRRRRNHKNSDDENRVFAAESTTTIQKKKRRALLSSSETPSPPPPPSFRKRADPVDSLSSSSNRRAARTPARRLSSPTTPKKNTPLLLLPDSQSVWQTGTYQTVRWNRKYTKKLPADTTVDIVLIDSKTNRKVSSLKRFVPFRKGGSQVWVPTNIPEGTSFVLVLELYRGRSQEQVTSALPSASANGSAQDAAPAGSSSYSHPESSNTSTGSSSSSNVGGSGPSSSQQQHQPTSTDVLSRIVRRSDINIAAGTKKRDIPNYPPGSSNRNSNVNNNNSNNRASKPTGTHHDINHDDFYAGPSQERPMEFLPDELRQEYPNTVRPLVLEHTFGLHQKVYTLTPYTLEWKIPERVAELLEYTRKAQELFNTYAKATSATPQARARARELLPKSTFLSKVLVEIIKDQNMESVSVLAKDVPAETMFQYLSIQDRLPPAFYRLRVQMVVVQVQTDVNAPPASTLTASKAASKAAMEGWEFPEGGEVIDRYEAITRRFWVSQGAL